MVVPCELAVAVELSLRQRQAEYELRVLSDELVLFATGDPCPAAIH